MQIPVWTWGPKADEMCGFVAISGNNGLLWDSADLLQFLCSVRTALKFSWPAYFFIFIFLWARVCCVFCLIQVYCVVIVIAGNSLLSAWNPVCMGVVYSVIGKLKLHPGKWTNLSFSLMNKLAHLKYYWPLKWTSLHNLCFVQCIDKVKINTLMEFWKTLTSKWCTDFMLIL